MSEDRRKQKRGAGVVEREQVARAQVVEWRRKLQAEQPELLGMVTAGAEKLPDDDKPSGPGRPVGARAAAPQEYRRFVLATKGDFVGRFAGLAQVDTLGLAQALGCPPLEALRIQLDAAKLAAPYVYQQQPRALEIDGSEDYYAGMVFAAGAAAGAATAGKGLLAAVAALAGRPPDMQEIQSLKPVEFGGSETAVSEPADDDSEKAP